jgi:TolB-like protein/Tfp pilus assembly protein PilF/tRNA A-37 threonylcarbamoyl transferase component Bud32
MIGQTISHYKILSKLGEGGMGVVYKAEDTKLHRFVALKFLPPSIGDEKARQRFTHEAQAVSTLEHPNICAIYEIDESPDGQMFIVMPCYEGASLQSLVKGGRLDLSQAVDIASQVAKGLAKAHEKGIVHRDVKPANILVTSDGLSKIVDFGLAKLATQTRLTRAGTTVGTVMYMSPEQARGEETDQRSDIWSLGVVLYEMVTGRPPFKGEHEQAIIYSILNTSPEPVGRLLPGAPKELERITAKALAKNPTERYQRMSELAGELDLLKETIQKEAGAPVAPVRRASKTWRWLGLGVVIAVVAVAALLARTYLSKPQEKPITSIAVLPLRNLSGDPAQDYFSDGMTDAIIKELSQIKALRVISMTSVMRYKNTEKPIPDIAHELGVEAVVEGSVLRADNDVRITAQLIAVHPEKHIWADDFTRTLENVLALQSEVAQAIAREIKVAVTPQESARLAASRPVNPEAHEAYLKGNHFWSTTNPRDWYMSIEYFQQAIDKDSTYAAAYAGMGKAYDTLASMNLMRPREAWPKVRAYAEKALSLDPSSVEGRLLIADVTFAFDWDIKRAEEYYQRAIELDPNFALAHFWYGYVLTCLGQFDGGIAEMKRALLLDPLAVPMMFNISYAHAHAGEYDSAWVYVRRAEEIASDADAAWIAEGKCYIHLMQGEYAEAVEEGKIAVAGKAPFAIDMLASAYALSGQTDRAQELLAKLVESTGESYYSPVFIATVYCALGEREKAFEYFEKAIEERDFSVIAPAYLPPWCDFVKSDPRYREFLKKVGIES